MPILDFKLLSRFQNQYKIKPKYEVCIDLRAHIPRYKKGLEIYEDRIEILNLERKLLQKELFPIKVN